MKLKELLIEERASGHKRLVASIISMMKKQTGKKPSWIAVEMYLKKLDKDEAFMDRIKKRSAQLGKDGYKWQAIRYRTIQHFSK